jgi:hypothetical protein
VHSYNVRAVLLESPRPRRAGPVDTQTTTSRDSDGCACASGRPDGGHDADSGRCCRVAGGYCSSCFLRSLAWDKPATMVRSPGRLLVFSYATDRADRAPSVVSRTLLFPNLSEAWLCVCSRSARRRWVSPASMARAMVRPCAKSSRRWTFRSTPSTSAHSVARRAFPSESGSRFSHKLGGPMSALFLP